MEPKMVLPGDQIAVAEEFEPGEGTYEKDGLVFASTPGVLQLDEQSRVARVRSSSLGTSSTASWTTSVA
jgi:exosome complex component CSL4